MARALGINAVFHDPAVALVVDGAIIAAPEVAATLATAVDRSLAS